MAQKLLFVVIFITQFSILQAQSDSLGGVSYLQKYQLQIRKSQTTIKLDGLLDETSWKAAKPISNFVMHWPQDNVPTKRQTEVKATFDDKFLYLAAVCYDTNYHVIQTLKRDAEIWSSDNFIITLDPVNQKTNGFMFAVSAANVQFEDLVSANTFNDPDGSWDNKWYSQTKIYNDRWVAEIAIPFKTLRFDPSKNQWGINFIRADVKNNQYSTWTFIPVNFAGYDLGYTGSLVWNELPPATKGNISLIPYATGGIAYDKEDDIDPSKRVLNAGLDAKVALSPSMNLDLTINPDFSQIEVDRQVTNLTRFNIFFPERRTFFLENNDLFSDFGSPSYRPFFSRRIGLDNNAQPVPIIAGARLSGNLDKNWRIGLMNMQTGKKGESPAQNFTAFTFARKILSRSQVRGYVLNRAGLLTETEKKADPMSVYGRNGGFEFNYSNTSGTITTWSGYHLSQKPTIQGKNSVLQLGGMYNGRNLSIIADYAEMGTNYYADMGFIGRIENFTYKLNTDGSIAKDTVIRLGSKQLFNEIEYAIRPKKGKINLHELNANFFTIWNPDNTLGEFFGSVGYEMGFKNTSSFSVKLEHNDVRALFPFLFTDSNFPLPSGKYTYNQYRFAYNSDYRKTFNYSLKFSTGGFYNGTLDQYQLQLNYRVQPWGNFGLNFERNDIKLPTKYGNDLLLLVSPRVEINLSNSIFWTTFLQFNTQRNNFNVNSRFQWRYKPMSDFFLVYTDNYFTDPLFKNKSRALVFKLNYWLTL